MRLVHVLVPAGRREAVLRELDAEKIDYALTPEVGREEYEVEVSFPLPATAVEPVVNRLREVGIEEDGFTVVLTAETVVSKRFEALRRSYPPAALSRPELGARAGEMAPPLGTFVVMTVVSAVVATTGLLSDSAAVIIGAMIIAPVMGPAIAASVGSVLYDRTLFRRGVRLQVLGVLLAIASALVFSLVLRGTLLVPPGLDPLAIPQVQERLTPSVLSLIIAVGAGVAAVFSLTRGVSSVLVGAMIAVALVPPAATVGIGIAWGDPLAVLEAGTLLLVNLLAVNLVALGLLWVSGYRPVEREQAGTARRRTVLTAAVIALALLLLSSVLITVSALSATDVRFEAALHEEIDEVLDRETYRDVRFVEAHVDVSPLRHVLFGEEIEVTVIVDTTGDPPPEGLAEDLRRTIAAEQGFEAIVIVEPVDASLPSDDGDGAVGGSALRPAPAPGPAR
jgi:uncharacterized hydrophobic protein (TIGR00341 family)